MLIANLVVSILVVERSLVVGVLVGEVTAGTVEVEGDTTLGILKELFLVVVVAYAKDAHVGLGSILRIL